MLKSSCASSCISRFCFPPSVIRSSKRFMGTANSNYTKTSTPSWNSIILDRLRNQRVDEARVLFDKIPYRDVHLYTMMITGYSRHNRLEEALQLFYEMPIRDVVSWNSMIKGCLDCGDLSMSRKLFDEMPERNVVSWTTMMNGFLQYGKIEMAEVFFCRMPLKDVAAWNSMIYGYCSWGRVEDALQLFREMPCRNVISWTSMISGFEQHGKSDKALFIFRQMAISGVEPTSSSFSCVLTACANILALHQGMQIHAHVLKLGYFLDTYISASLITFYAKCKIIEDSCKVFNEKLHINVVIWTALLTGYGLNNKHGDALKAFGDMMRMDVLPNQSSFTSALNSCCALEAFDKGREIHTAAIKLGLETDAFVGNSLVVMYSKCGHMKDSIATFKTIRKKNIVSWNSIIVGCGQHGFGWWALTLFNQMIRAWIEPDEITLTGLLSACSHSGMLHKGRTFFEYFSQYKSIELKLEHFACMVDILGRCGKLKEAEDLIKNMPIKANSMVWLALLSACRMHSNLEVAERAANSIFDLDTHCSAAYVLLSNLYASICRWNDVSRIREQMKQRGIVKQPGCSWVTLRGMRHVFLSGDRSHPLSKKIYQKLDWLGGKLKEFGYVPDQRFALHDVEDEQKEEILSYHSERLAIGFGLVATIDGCTITVMKNLRVCGDCHSVIKIIAKIVEREIIVRDSTRFHHFRDGICSCGDYW
ncbi:pentatricopeptide repeat-containing protein At5g46460, mitochondrial [Malania oleifera]|uniref:pentatricopeptide repeat-containing protein At5g46460, mitochondrial n=1 Tax=Malania oleifera TaxID=397392 RepID=UPI0025ADA22C|nr:pentatricopeptide repeat-containing protein At5g46460, mitochondrial [Malania oleifera]